MQGMSKSTTRIRSADDPKNPEAVVIERLERLQLKANYFSVDNPRGWVITAWHPNREEAARAVEDSKARGREDVEQADALLAQLSGAPEEQENDKPDFGHVVWRWYRALGTDAQAAIDRSVGRVGMAMLVRMLETEADKS